MRHFRRERELLGPHFQALWLSQFASVLGSQLSFVATPLVAFELTRSATTAGVVGFVNAIARVAAGIPAGAIADRYNRRSVLLVCDAVRAAAMGLFVAGVGLMSADATIALLIACVAVESAFSAIFGPAERAFVRRLVADEHLPLALARNETREWTASVIGPLVAGGLYSTSLLLPFLGNALSYTASLLLLATIPERFGSPPPAGTPPGSGNQGNGWAEGLKQVWATGFLRRAVAQSRGCVISC